MDLTWQTYRVLDLATEDEFWLNEVSASSDIRAGLPSAIERGLVSLYNKGQPVPATEGLQTLKAERAWTDPSISFYATDAGRAAYFALTTEDIIRLNTEARAAEVEDQGQRRPPTQHNT